VGTVLVVDDDDRIRSGIARLLATQGHQTVVAADGDEALIALATTKVDLVVLDLVMPGTNGMQLLGLIRDHGTSVPVIMLSAVEDVAARVQALDLGAVDFVGKPFVPAELLARVRRQLANGVAAAPLQPQRYLMAAGVTLDLDRRRASYRDKQVDLTERETGLLAHLMRRAGVVCSREEILRDVWGLDDDPGSNVVEACIRRLRSKLSDPPIQTVRSVGYCFERA
jgi:DNA-binding response OmpR family regulator